MSAGVVQSASGASLPDSEPSIRTAGDHQLAIRGECGVVEHARTMIPDQWMKDGEIRLAPESVDNYQVSRRGRPPRMLVTVGSKEGMSMRIRVVGGELEVSRKEGGLVEGQVTSWDKVGVITGLRREARSDGTETTYRYWLLEPGGV